MRNILFDLDGTLTNPQEGFVKSIQYSLEKLGATYGGDISQFIGPPLHMSLSTILNSKDESLIGRAVEYYRERYADRGLYENSVYSGTPEALDALLSDGYTLFVATSKPEIFAKHILKHFDLDKKFKEIYGSRLNGELTDKGELIAYLLAQEHLTAKDCLMIGDRKHDAIGAFKNQMKCVGVGWGYGSVDELLKAGVEKVLAHPSDLQALESKNN